MFTTLIVLEPNVKLPARLLSLRHLRALWQAPCGLILHMRRLPLRDSYTS